MDATNLILKDEVCRIVGAALAVLQELGHGLQGKPCENALVVEFGLRGTPRDQPRRFPAIDQDVQVSECVPDSTAFGRVIVNFKHAKLEWERMTLSDHSRPLASIRG